MRTALSERFAGGLVRSLLKDFDPSQPRDFHGRWTITGRGAPAPSGAGEVAVEERPAPPRSEFDEEIRRLKKTSGITYEKSEHADPRAEVVVQRAASSMPIGIRSAMKSLGIKVRVVTAEDMPKETFTVAGNTFVKGGHADYRNREVVVWEDRLNIYVVQHEIGHMAVAALAAMVAKGDDRREVLLAETRKITDRKYEIADKFYDANNRSIRSGEDPEYDRIVVREGEIDGEIEEINSLERTLRKFDDATLEEGGFTDYSDSYVKDEGVGHRTDVWEYLGPIRSESWSKVHEGSGMGPRGAITRAANENFAEIVSHLGNYKPGYFRTAMKVVSRDKPKTAEAFKRLWRVFSRRVVVPPVKEV